MAADPRSETDLLREQVGVLSAGLGLGGDFRVPADVRAHAEAGRNLQAIRELRRQAPGRLGLIPAKRMVEALQRPRRARDSVRLVRQRVSSGSTYETTIGFSRAVRDGDRVFVSATAAIWPDGHVDADAGAQARRSLEIIEHALREAGASLSDVVRTRVFLVDAADGDAVGRVHGEVLGDVRPASAFIVVSGFLDPRWRVEIEADAIVGE